MSFPPETFSLLGNVPLFSGLQGNLLARHFGHSRRLLAEGNTLRSLDGPEDGIYIILSGCLRGKQDDVEGGPMLTFGAGEAVSEISIPDRENAFDFLTAAADCELLYVDSASILALANDSPQAAATMLSVLAAGITASKRGNHGAESEHGYASLNYVDELTGLYNGQWMLKAFERQLHRAIINSEPAVLMLTGIDQFERYRQSHGSLGGDQALRSIAQTILTCLRPNDQAAHYYGEVFAIFMPHTTLEDAKTAAQRLQTQASQANIVIPTGDALPHVTLSIGLAEVAQGIPLQHLIEQATEAMHKAR